MLLIPYELKTLINELKNGLNDTLNNWIYVKEYKNVQVFKKLFTKHRPFKYGKVLILEPSRNHDGNGFDELFAQRHFD